MGEPNLRPQDPLRTALLERRQRLAAAPHPSGHSDIHALLVQVDDALNRLESGTFGECERCDGRVEEDRLAADPLVRVCLECLTEPETRRLEQDLSLAGSIQSGLLPPSTVVHEGWEVHYRYVPHGPVSGDHCDILRPASSGDPLYFMLGDVSGKGVSASLLMANLQAIFRSLVAQEPRPAAMVEQANRLFCESTLPNSYATLVVGRLDPSGAVELCNAGHCEPIAIRDGNTSTLPASGLPLGLFCEVRYEAHRFELGRGDLLALYTDGLSEATDRSGEPFGAQRIESAVRRASDGSTGVVSRCLEELARFQAGHSPDDDLTVMVVSRETRPA